MAFIAWEMVAKRPLIPLRIFQSRHITGANLVQALSIAGMFAMFFLGSLYIAATVIPRDPAEADEKSQQLTGVH